MGWHLCIYGTDSNFKNIKNPIIDRKNFKELLTGHDANAGLGRAVFTTLYSLVMMLFQFYKFKIEKKYIAGINPKK
jgi:hypothetical protein